MITHQFFLASSDPDGISMPLPSYTGSADNTDVWHYAVHVSTVAVVLSDILCVACYAVLNVILGLECYYSLHIYFMQILKKSF